MNMINKFSAYRHYEDALINANDSMMALLVGSQLSKDVLIQHSDTESLLPDLYPLIPEIKRLSRTTKDAANILGKSEYYLSNMAVVYTLAVHQSFMDAVKRLLNHHGYELVAYDLDGEQVRIDSANIYKAIEDCLGLKLDEDLMRQFYFMRRIRNRIVHFGGKPGGRLKKECGSMTKSETDTWKQMTKRSLKELLSGEKIELTANEMMAALALSRRVVHNIHDLLIAAINKDTWARIVVEDCANSDPSSFGDSANGRKYVSEFARQFYSGLDLTKDELENAIDQYLSSIEDAVT